MRLCEAWIVLHGGFHLTLPWIVAQEVRRFRPDVVLTQSPYEALPVLGVLRTLRERPKLVVEIQGDWRSATRFYGSRSRRFFASAADRAAALVLRRADGTRAISDFTAALAEQVTGRKPLATFPTYTNLESFIADEEIELPARVGEFCRWLTGGGDG